MIYLVFCFDRAIRHQLDTNYFVPKLGAFLTVRPTLILYTALFLNFVYLVCPLLSNFSGHTETSLWCVKELTA